MHAWLRHTIEKYNQFQECAGENFNYQSKQGERGRREEKISCDKSLQNRCRVKL